jgi:hypothetical protein
MKSIHIPASALLDSLALIVNQNMMSVSFTVLVTMAPVRIKLTATNVNVLLESQEPTAL